MNTENSTQILTKIFQLDKKVDKLKREADIDNEKILKLFNDIQKSLKGEYEVCLDFDIENLKRIYTLSLYHNKNYIKEYYLEQNLEKEEIEAYDFI
jgi:hypothetical protein